MKLYPVLIILSFYLMCIFSNVYTQSTTATIQVSNNTIPNSNSSNVTTAAATTKSDSIRNAASILILIPFIFFKLFDLF